MLSRDDESLLSAYIDGELGEEDVRRLEAEIAGDRRLAEMVRELRAVGELVVDLPRPTAPDLSTEILRLVQARGDGLARRRRSVAVAAWIAGGIAASAAALVVGVGLFRDQASRLRPPEPGRHLPEIASVLPAGGAEPKAVPDRPAPIPSRASVPTPAIVAESPADRDRLRTLMDDPSLRRAFLITDRIGGEAEPRVASLLEKATHRDFYKITVSQGIVVDPRHPGEATVFAVVVDEMEMGPLRRELEGEFGPRLEDVDVAPAVAMQLADVGQVVSLPAKGAGELTFPTASMALKARADGLPTPEQERSSPAADLHDPATAPPRGASVSETRVAGGLPPRERPRVVLLWVRRPDRG